MRGFPVLALGVMGCATAARAPVVEPVTELATPIIRGPAFDAPRTRRCSTEEAVMGPVTVAGGWGGRLHACRTGPVPRSEFLRRVRSDRLFRGCLSRASVTSFDALVRFSRDGAVISIAIDAPADVGDIEHCLGLLTRYRLGNLGCELDAPVHITAL